MSDRKSEEREEARLRFLRQPVLELSTEPEDDTVGADYDSEQDDWYGDEDATVETPLEVLRRITRENVAKGGAIYGITEDVDEGRSFQDGPFSGSFPVGRITR